jgi:cell wall-associated NlpC family hydrolase
LRSTSTISRRLATIAVLAFSIAALAASPAGAQSGGTSAPGGDTTVPTETVPGAKAKLLKSGKAVAPADAPEAVKRVIAAGNRIRKKPYVYGGGHKSFKSKGYDCSGAVSFVLRAAGVLESPLPSGSLMKWGEAGKGSWITVYANAGHTYAVVAGLRWDTSAVGEPVNRGSGPRWRSTKRSPKGYVARHAPAY